MADNIADGTPKKRTTKKTSTATAPTATAAPQAMNEDMRERNVLAAYNQSPVRRITLVTVSLSCSSSSHLRFSRIGVRCPSVQHCETIREDDSSQDVGPSQTI